MVLESGVGQYFRTSLLASYEQVSKKYRGVPITGVLTCLCVSTYYIYLMAYCLIYIKVSGLVILDIAVYAALDRR